MNNDYLECLNCGHLSGRHRPDMCGMPQCVCPALKTRYGVHYEYAMFSACSDCGHMYSMHSALAGCRQHVETTPGGPIKTCQCSRIDFLTKAEKLAVEESNGKE